MATHEQSHKRDMYLIQGREIDGIVDESMSIPEFLWFFACQDQHLEAEVE